MAKKANTTPLNHYCSLGAEELLAEFSTSRQSLSAAEAHKRLLDYGLNEPVLQKKWTLLVQLASKFINPLVIVLIIIGTFEYFLEIVLGYLTVTQILKTWYVKKFGY